MRTYVEKRGLRGNAGDTLEVDGCWRLKPGDGIKTMLSETRRWQVAICGGAAPTWVDVR